MKRVEVLSLLSPLLLLLNLNFVPSVSSAVIINLSLSSQLPLIAHPNQPYSWSFQQDSFQSQPPAPLTYSASGLPDWCKFDPNTLTFSGTPSNDDVERRDITVTATQTNTGTGARKREAEGLDWLPVEQRQELLDELSVNNLVAMGSGRAAQNHKALEAEKSQVERAATLARRQDGDSTSDGFQLIVLNQPEPILNKPLDQQLPQASSLGRGNILPSGALHLPFGWSFSIGFAGDTFSSPDGSTIFYSTILGDGQPIPDWLIWSPDTFTMYGVAPNNIGPEGAEFKVIITASNREDFSGASSSFTVVLGSNQLSFNGPLRKANATAGESFRYKIPTTGLQYDGKQVDQSSNLTISSNLTDSKMANLQWLSFDPASSYLSGTPPFDFVGKDDEKTSVSVPLTFTDQTTSTSVSSDLELDVYPSAFTSPTIPNIFVEPGRPFNTSLISFIRQPKSNNSIINPIYDPPNATSWLSFNQTSYLFSGRPPMEPENDRVKVQLEAIPEDPSRGNLTSTTRFYIALKDDKNPGGEDTNGGTSNGSTNSDHNGGGLSQRGKVALAASLGTAGGIVGLILLMIICRRCCAAEEHDVQGRPYDASPALSDDRTLTGGNSPKMMSVGAWKKAKASPNPSTLVGSPYLDPSTAEKGGDAWSSSNKNQGGLERVSLSNDYQNGGGDGRSSPVIEDAYIAYRRAEEMASSNQYLSTSASQQDSGKPRQNGLFASIWGGAGGKSDSKKAKRSLAQNAAVNNAHNYGSSGSGLGGLGLSGLGLEAENGMNSPPSDNPYPNVPPHSRSRHSIRTIGNGNGRPGSRASMASWEEGGVYYSDGEDDGIGREGAASPESQRSFHSVDPANIPVRRGAPLKKSNTKSKAANTSPMRHRNAHINESPAFNAPAMFDTTSSDGEGRNQDGEDNAVIHQAHHVTVRSFNDGLGGPSRKGSVPTHQAVFSDQSQRNVSQHVAVDEAFEDAEDDEYNLTMSKSKSSQNSRNKRSSYVPERMSNTSAIIYGDNSGNHLNPFGNNEQLGYSPNPANSIFGGASFNSNMNPEDTMKVVSSNPEAPPTPQIGSSSNHHGYQRVQSYSNSNSNRIQHHIVRVGEFVRIQVSLNEPPPMRGGAPGSPGKRSGRRITYVPILERDVEDQDDGPWPPYMDWLSWDPRLFELAGTVPDGIFPRPCRLVISIIAKKDFTPGSPGKSSNSGGHSNSSRPGHKRMNSFDSNATTAYGSGNESGDEIASRLVLEIPHDDDDDAQGYEIQDLQRVGEGGGLGPSAF